MSLQDEITRLDQDLKYFKVSFNKITVKPSYSNGHIAPLEYQSLTFLIEVACYSKNSDVRTQAKKLLQKYGICAKLSLADIKKGFKEAKRKNWFPKIFAHIFPRR